MFLKYLKDRIKLIVFLVTFVATFSVVIFLYGLPLEPVLYADILCFTLSIIIAVCDFIIYKEKHSRLRKLAFNIVVEISELPHPQSRIEEDYQELIKALVRQRSKMISEADNARTEMIDYYTLWAHQIKTPISAMSVLLQDMQGEPKEQLTQELFKIERYAEMVLQYLRLESMNSDLLLQRYNLDSIIKQAVKKYAPLFIHKKISLDFKETGRTVLTDEKWLVFVIEQLLSNAVKYTNSGTISVYCENDYLVIEDTGIGISEEDLPRIFEKGFTGCNGRMDKKSTGLGLYLCKKILDKLCHGIKITSKQGKGTRVLLFLFSDDITLE